MTCGSDRRSTTPSTGGSWTEIAGDCLPTDQYLPPGMPGFKDVDIYPFTPNVAAARRLAGTQRRTAILYTHNQAAVVCLPATRAGHEAEPGRDRDRRRDEDLLGGCSRRRGSRSLASRSISPTRSAWYAVYPIPQSFLGLPGIRILDTPFDDPSYKRKVRAASRLSGPRRYLAYGALDVDTARNAAPVVAIGNKFNLDFFSARMGCQVFSPVFGIDLAALCIRP